MENICTIILLNNKKVLTIYPNQWQKYNEVNSFIPELTPQLSTREQCLSDPNSVIEARNKWTTEYFDYLKTLKGYTPNKPCNVIKAEKDQDNTLKLFDPYGGDLLQDVLPTVQIIETQKQTQNKIAHLFENKIEVNRLALEVPFNGIIGLGHEFGHFLDPQGLVMQAEREMNGEKFKQMEPGLDRIFFTNDYLLKPKLVGEARAWHYANPLFDFWSLPESTTEYIRNQDLGGYFNYWQPAAITAEVYAAQKSGIEVDLSTGLSILDSQLNQQTLPLGTIVDSFTNTYTKMGMTNIAEALDAFV